MTDSESKPQYGSQEDSAHGRVIPPKNGGVQKWNFLATR